MIEAVSTLSVQSSAARVAPQAGASFASGGSGVAALYSNQPQLGRSLSVRIDSAAERAILEVRSSETGEVVNQYPSEAQLKAFQRAQKLEAAQAEQAAVSAAREKAARPNNTDVAQTQPKESVAPAQSTPTPAPTTVSTAPDVTQATGGGFSDTSAAGGQSVIV
jgi:hypothetical protein